MSAVPAPESEARRPRLLVVEDNPLNQKVVARYLRHHGFEVDVAETTTAAEARMQQAPPLLILMDISLPGEDGLSFVTRLRRQGNRTPIIALTAHAMAGDQDKALHAGCTDYATKPCELLDLLALVRRHLPVEEL